MLRRLPCHPLPITVFSASNWKLSLFVFKRHINPTNLTKEQTTILVPKQLSNMSHRYGERFPPRSQGHSKPSFPSASFIHSNDQEANALATSAGSDITTENATATIP